EWQALVSAWLEFEKVSGYEGSRRLGSRSHPRTVADWIQRARSPAYCPEIKNIAAFAADFTAWWQNVQPAWRTESATDQMPHVEGNWEDIRCPGLNGLLSIIAALFFWGNAI
ncbi:hypothetical protein HYPSUDRAFT_102262, partial [Hypholoma sublateritium FD-334 SS-4]